jgi:cytochrome c5
MLIASSIVGILFVAADERSIARLQAAGQAATAAAAPATAPDRALLDKYCVTCHNDRLKTAGFTVEKLDIGNVHANGQTLEKIVRKLRSAQMPPQGRPQPDKAVADAFAASLERELDKAAAGAPNPGRVASRRLNRAEYVNVIYDLLALDVDGTQLLPSDMAGYGFDNNADVLSITPGLMSRYMSAATKISRLAMASPENRPVMQVYKVDVGAKQDQRMGDNMPFATHGGIAVKHTFPLDGEYTFKVRMVRNGTVSTIEGIDEDEHQIEIRVDHALIKRFAVGGKLKGPDPGVLIAVPEDDIEGQKVHDYRLNADNDLEIKVPIKAGTRLISASFTDSLPSPLEGSQRRGRRDGAAAGIDMLYVSGPFNGKGGDTLSRRQILTCRPASKIEEEPCARRIITSLAKRAYRRPVTEAEIKPLLAIYNEGRSERDFDAGIERSLEAMLSSPKFLIRIERESSDGKTSNVYRLSDLELASRLSFFLWRSFPDDELIDLAEKGRLKHPAVLTQQVKRLMSDRKATRFLNDFAGQWLQVRNIQASTPDQQKFPDFEDTLRQAMTKETELFFESQVRENRPITELLNANYTFLNERLARHYGIEDVYGSHFRRVTLTDERRMGLLGQSSVLTVSSYADRTSVVLRGKWVLENLLGAPPPPPPPNVPPLKENDGKSKPTALRERMEAHRANPVCASCHAPMDPLGFALEHYDAVGKWRENDGGAEINSTITWGGRTVDSPRALREALLSRGDEFIRTVAEKLLTYALGRGVDYPDAPVVRQLVRDLGQNENRWSALVLSIVKTPQFQMRRTTGANDVPPAAGTNIGAQQQ